MRAPWLVVAVALVASTLSAGSAAQPAPVTPTLGAYTAAQAERGKGVYEQSCASCHGPSLRGGANEFAAPALAGPFFYETWNGRTVEELFRYGAENMPPDQSRLSDSAYLDVTAYILQVLKYDAGAGELTPDSPIMKQPITQKP